MRILVKGHIVHDGKTYTKGDEFTISKDAGERLVSLGIADDITKKKSNKNNVNKNLDDNGNTSSDNNLTLEELQEQAKALGIDTTDMTIDMLIDEMSGY